MSESKAVDPPPSVEPARSPLPPAPTKRSRRWKWLIVGCGTLAGVLLWRWHGSASARSHPAPAQSAPPPAAVSTAVIRKGDIGIYVNALGAVTPVYTVMLKSRVDGQLMQVNYVEGQMVHTGDSLVEIDPRPFQAQLLQAQGQLARDKALLENAQVDLQRYQTAFSKNAIPKQQLDTQLATVHQFLGTVDYDQGLVDTARLQLAYAHITAPISGRVGLRLVDPGNIVHASDANALAVITQLQPITVLFSVAEDYLPEIQKQLSAAQTLPVQALDRSQQKTLASGTLLTLDNQIDPATGTIRLKALFSNEDNALFPNQFVNARLRVSTEQNTPIAPTAAIQRNGQGSFVYLVQPNATVTMRPVRAGHSDGAFTAVQGLAPGEVIATDNFNRLQEGAKVIVGKPPIGKAGPALAPEANPQAGSDQRRSPLQ